MKILDHKQVIYCNLVNNQQETIEYLPGLIFQNKLFIKDRSFALEQQKNAQDYGKEQFLDKKGQIEYLLLEDVTGFIIWKEDNQVQLLEKYKKDEFLSKKSLQTIVDKIRGTNGIEIKDRRYRLKMYPKCFVGNELVDWMIKNLSISSEQAVKLGQGLIDEKFIHHVNDQHQFKNEHLFYRFYSDES